MGSDATLAVIDLAYKPPSATARRDNVTMAKAKPSPHSLISVALAKAMAASADLQSQNALAKRSGVGQTTIGRILRSETDPGTEVVRKLARALQVPIATLFGESVKPAELTRANGAAELGAVSHATGPDPAILHEAVTLLLFDLDHGGPRPARSASDLLLDLYRRLVVGGGRLSKADQWAFEDDARSRGQKPGATPHVSRKAAARKRAG